MFRLSLQILVASTMLTVTFAASLPEIYRDAKAALESGDAAKAVSLLEPALAGNDGDEAQRLIAGFALGTAYLRTGKAEAAVPLLEKAAAQWSGTPQAANALAPLGDAYRQIGKADDAREAYEKALVAAPDGLEARYAKARVLELHGERQLAAKEYLAAAKSFLSAADQLLILGRKDATYFADARALYTKVAQGKEWRGESTAEAVFSLGEVEFEQGHLPEAIAYYQRTFVSWVRYPHWCAQAYLRAAESMDRLGKRDFAIQHLWEMVRKADKFKELPEYQQAKKQLREWGQDVK